MLYHSLHCFCWHLVFLIHLAYIVDANLQSDHGRPYTQSKQSHALNYFTIFYCTEAISSHAPCSSSLFPLAQSQLSFCKAPLGQFTGHNFETDDLANLSLKQAEFIPFSASFAKVTLAIACLHSVEVSSCVNFLRLHFQSYVSSIMAFIAQVNCHYILTFL